MTNTKDKLVKELEGIYGGRDLAASLSEGRDFIHLITPASDIRNVSFSKGNGPQNIENPIDTSFNSFYNEVILPQIESGKLGDGIKTKFDDRKVRLDDSGVVPVYTLVNEVFRLKVGPTDYMRFKEDSKRSDEENLALMLRGVQENGKPWKYFAKPLGVAVLPVTKDGHVYIGERLGNVDRPGLLCSVAGQMTFNEDVNKISALADEQKELKEEFGIEMKLDSENTRFAGISAFPKLGDADVVLAVKTDVPDAYFDSGDWMKKVSEREHKSLVPIKRKDDAEILLNEGRLPNGSRKYEMIYSTRLGLEYLARKTLR